MKSLIPLLLIALATASCSKPAPLESSGADESAALSVTHIDAATAAELLKTEKDVTVLDVRTPEEYVAGHIAGAINIDFQSPDFSKKVSAELYDKHAYLLHCRSGWRSTAALQVLQGLGFERLYHLDGGISAWGRAGLPVEK